MADIDGLTKEQTQEYNKYKKMFEFFDEHSAQVGTYPPLQDEVTEFNKNIGDVEDLLPKKTVDTRGITDEKEVRKTKVAEYWFSKVLSPAKAYALKVRNTDLAVNLRRSISDIEEMRDGDVQPYCKQINDALTPLLPDPGFVPYGITAMTLSDGMQVANDFKDYIGKAKDENTKKTVAGGNIDLEFTELRNNNVQFRLLMEHFKTSDADFYSGFQAVDVEDDIGIRHSGIEGIIKSKSDGSPINGAVIKNLTKDKATKSDLTGVFSLIKQMPGNSEFEITAPGKKRIKFIHKVKRGRIDELNFEMEDE